MSFLTLGVVSNVWSNLLPGSSLDEQCRRAVDAGYGYVELRQRALGRAEEAAAADDRPWPVPERLARLRAAIPELRFNLAVEAPFLTTPIDPEAPYFLRCCEAARALGEPHVLRLVDLSPAPELLTDTHLQPLAESAAGLAETASRGGVRLALENSKQPVAVLRSLIRRAGALLSTGAPTPQICWDPHNQILQQLSPEDPLETAQALRPKELFEFHFKQGRNGALQPDVAEGELDWEAILTAVRRSDYRGPALFEIPGGPDIWDRLQRSTEYINGLLSRVASGSE